MKLEPGILLYINYKKVISMFEHNILFNSMMIMVIILSYMLFKSIKSKKDCIKSMRKSIRLFIWLTLSTTAA